MALSLVLVLLMLVLSALASSSSLHHLLHPDSDSADHHCLVTVFASGQLTGSGTTRVIVLFAVAVVFAAVMPDLLPRPVFDYRSAPSRAPPRF